MVSSSSVALLVPEVFPSSICLNSPLLTCHRAKRGIAHRGRLLPVRRYSSARRAVMEGKALLTRPLSTSFCVPTSTARAASGSLAARLSVRATSFSRRARAVEGEAVRAEWEVAEAIYKPM